ncbi:MAG: peptide-methionine (R)-S-oxide reductase MsrB [Saprospiraceae bacterium]
MNYFSLALAAALTMFAACNSSNNPASAQSTDAPAAESTAMSETNSSPDYKYNPPADPENLNKIDKTDAEWKAELSDEAYRVLRQEGTQRAYSEPELLNNKKEGIYTCSACGLPLFSSATKFESGTGWPSFYEPLNPLFVGENEDTSYGMRRVEVHCARCDGHQGHVFPDGPEPTGLRYCINAVSLDFVPEAEVKE